MDEKNAPLFNEIYREICDAVGMEGAMAIYKLYRGQQITFPVHLFNSKRISEKIPCEYDGSNMRELSKKYGYSEKTLRRMIKENSEK